jgi:hypothetical protein
LAVIEGTFVRNNSLIGIPGTSGTSDAGGVVAQGRAGLGATYVLRNCRLDSRADSSFTPVVWDNNDGLTIILENTELLAHASATYSVVGSDTIYARSVTANKPIDPNTTIVGDFRDLDGGVNVSGAIHLGKTITATGTTGDQTINKAAGSVNFAAGTSYLTVTNSLVSASSVVVATVATTDNTMTGVWVDAYDGGFVLTANAAASAETRVNFIVIP